MRYVATGPMTDIAVTERLLADYTAHQLRHGYSFWAVIERASGALIGDAGLYRTPAGEVELGYTLGAAWWGRGYATEAASRWLAFAFGELGLSRGGGAGRAGERRLAARAREARDAARRGADRVRAPAHRLPRSARGQHGLDPVEHPLKAELEVCRAARRSRLRRRRPRSSGSAPGRSTPPRTTVRSSHHWTSVTPLSRAICSDSTPTRVAPVDVVVDELGGRDLLGGREADAGQDAQEAVVAGEDVRAQRRALAERDAEHPRVALDERAAAVGGGVQPLRARDRLSSAGGSSPWIVSSIRSSSSALLGT